MSFSTRAYNIAVSTLAFLACVNCGGGKESKSSVVEVVVTPEKPIVFTGPTRDERDNIINPPWFDFRMSMNNVTAQAITVVGITAEVFSQGDSGAESKTVTFTPADYNFRINAIDCKFTSFGTWAAGESKGFSLRNGLDTCNRVPRFLVGDVSTSATVTSYRYRVRVKPLGWFGTETLANDRFEKVITFYTQ